MGQKETSLVDPLRTRVAVAVITLWIIVALVALVKNNITELGIVTPAVMLILGALFTYYNKNGDDSGGGGNP